MHPVTGRAHCLRSWMLTGAQDKTLKKCAWNKRLCIHRTRSCDKFGVIGACGLSQRSIIFWPTAVHLIAEAQHMTWSSEETGFKEAFQSGVLICLATSCPRSSRSTLVFTSFASMLGPKPEDPSDLSPPDELAQAEQHQKVCFSLLPVDPPWPPCLLQVLSALGALLSCG